MAIPSTQSIRLSDISVELGLPRTTKMALGHPDVRTFLGIPSGKVGLGQVRGASFGRTVLNVVFNTSTQSALVDINTLSGYVAGKTDIIITVNSGVYLWSDSTAIPGLRIIGGVTGDTVKLINNGFIIGKGGTGGCYVENVGPVDATAGGSGMSITYPITIDTTNGYIGGGGGGGGSGTGGGGGGAGGGLNGYYPGWTAQVAGGAIGNIGNNGTVSSDNVWASGGSGGRQIPGTVRQGPLIGPGSSVSLVGLGGSAGGSGCVSTICGVWASGGGGGWGAAGGDCISYINYQPLSAGHSARGGQGSASNAKGGDPVYVGPVTALTPSYGAAGGRGVQTNGHVVTFVGTSASRVFGAVA